MNWEAISAIGQLVGVLAVVISLIYLARKVRSNARATVLSLLLSTAVSGEPVKHRPVSVRLEPVAYEESVVGELLNFLDVKIARYMSSQISRLALFTCTWFSSSVICRAS